MDVQPSFCHLHIIIHLWDRGNEICSAYTLILLLLKAVCCYLAESMCKEIFSHDLLDFIFVIALPILLSSHSHHLNVGQAKTVRSYRLIFVITYIASHAIIIYIPSLYLTFLNLSRRSALLPPQDLQRVPSRCGVWLVWWWQWHRHWEMHGRGSAWACQSNHWCTQPEQW